MQALARTPPGSVHCRMCARFVVLEAFRLSCGHVWVSRESRALVRGLADDSDFGGDSSMFSGRDGNNAFMVRLLKRTAWCFACSSQTLVLSRAKRRLYTGALVLSRAERRLYTGALGFRLWGCSTGACLLWWHDRRHWVPFPRDACTLCK